MTDLEDNEGRVRAFLLRIGGRLRSAENLAECVRRRRGRTTPGTSPSVWRKRKNDPTARRLDVTAAPGAKVPELDAASEKYLTEGLLEKVVQETSNNATRLLVEIIYLQCFTLSLASTFFALSVLFLLQICCAAPGDTLGPYGMEGYYGAGVSCLPWAAIPVQAAHAGLATP